MLESALTKAKVERPMLWILRPCAALAMFIVWYPGVWPMGTALSPQIFGLNAIAAQSPVRAPIASSPSKKGGAGGVAEKRWMTLPPTPQLPPPRDQGFVSTNGGRIYYAVFGTGDPVIFLHGGLANSNYWADQISVVSKHYEAVAIDTRAHGRSGPSSMPLTYDLLASDVVAVMDSLHMQTATLVGWSDGAITALKFAMLYPQRTKKVFAFAANFDSSGLIPNGGQAVTFKEFVNRTEKEYGKLSSTPNEYRDLRAALRAMWSTEPNFNSVQLARINVPVWVVDGDHDEIIKLDHTEKLARLIPFSHLEILRQVSHFAMLQDPDEFNAILMAFLEGR
jgi:pimeloyl-ACP methyl ester carboxylesterase